MKRPRKEDIIKEEKEWWEKKLQSTLDLFKKTANPEHILEAKIILSDLLNKKKRKISYLGAAYARLQVLPPLYDYLAEGEIEKLMEAKECIDEELEIRVHYTKWKEERRKERKIREENADGSWNSVTRSRFILFLKETSGDICPGCQNKMDHPTLDHIVPLADGGSNLLENMRLLCRSCNSSKGTLTWEEFQQKKIPIGDEIHQICFRFNIGVKKISQILDISIESASELLNGNYQIFPFENLISYSEKMKHWKDSEGRIYEKKEDLMQKIRHLRVVHGLTLGGMAERLRVPEKERNRIFNGNLRSFSILISTIVPPGEASAQGGALFQGQLQGAAQAGSRA